MIAAQQIAGTNNVVSKSVKDAFTEASQYFPTPIQQFQFLDKYSRFNYDFGRRETWIETVDRAVSYLRELSKNKLRDRDYDKIRDFILNMKAAPSMRLLAMSGEAARRQNICIYNCSYLPVDSIDSWVEALIISMSGCGVGFSVENRYVDKLPPISKFKFDTKAITHIVQDTTEGWAEALRLGLQTWFAGLDISFDFSQIRPAGTVLRVKGGTASGPQPLKKMLKFIRKIILANAGKKLTPLQAHDIMCSVGDAAVSGGMRRTAMISLFDYEDGEMRNCKNGKNLEGNEQRWNANNSAVWNVDQMTQAEVITQMVDMDKGQRGEPGIFSRDAANRWKPARRQEQIWGTNPCGEIVLRPYQFCNLSIAIARSDDTLETLKEKVKVATMIGTIQSMATNFPGLRSIWKKNCEEERLLGTDITGEMDNSLLQREYVLAKLKEVAIETNRHFSKVLGINRSAAITCIKPSGNSSQLFNCSSGLHPRWAKYYIRNVRVSTHSPVFNVLKDAHVPMNPENGQKAEDAITWVVHFPIKSPEGAKTRHDLTAINQCENWLRNKLFFTEHNPSCTVTYKPDELIDLIKWIWNHKEMIGGLSFLPHVEAQYEQMPYEEITKEQYQKLIKEFPVIDFSRITLYEKYDQTTSSQEAACIGKDSCELDLLDLIANKSIQVT